ncbi:gas vesicle protein [Streptomyces sp. NPDC059991]|uniref:gas vesicle protein n=1 Tax=unclassified Streptomyces TaxID=2593676 RepID=UPI0036769FF6
MTRTASADGGYGERQIALVDLLDRLLAGGVVLAGDLTLRIADVDLVRVDLNALVSSVSAEVPSPFESAYESDGAALPASPYGLLGEGT